MGVTTRGALFAIPFCEAVPNLFRDLIFIKFQFKLVHNVSKFRKKDATSIPSALVRYLLVESI